MLVDFESLEITTKIGCQVQCLKYCVQEMIVKAYRGEKFLTLEAFDELISTVPSEVVIVFGGVSEPFGNPYAAEMMKRAYLDGHDIIVFTTLVGLSIDDAAMISRIPFKEFIMHLPDNEGNANIPITPEYVKVLTHMMLWVSKIRYMSMNGCFVSDDNEKYFRGEYIKPKRGSVKCVKHTVPSYYMMPNGNVYFCCQTRGLTTEVGSLYKNTYTELVNRFKSCSIDLQTNPDSICHRCSLAEPKWWYNMKRLAKRLTNDYRL